ncbi:hypothetical protein IWQ60_002869 [Tieghemiomyces parasiticus]|uniref:Polymerase/histidinol phosphatase N-terminal domain-containing protein n=1 Tax=Tieghemiomyces parasiticus TaxID=78921 RepID=A0A9W8AED1_9FUNG|nr:hypothetical protein IWQ60_002869 [Tieghemiomyces parasiticus]
MPRPYSTDGSTLPSREPPFDNHTRSPPRSASRLAHIVPPVHEHISKDRIDVTITDPWTRSDGHHATVEANDDPISSLQDAHHYQHPPSEDDDDDSFSEGEESVTSTDLVVLTAVPAHRSTAYVPGQRMASRVASVKSGTPTLRRGGRTPSMQNLWDDDKASRSDDDRKPLDGFEDPAGPPSGETEGSSPAKRLGGRLAQVRNFMHPRQFGRARSRTANSPPPSVIVGMWWCARRALLLTLLWLVLLTVVGLIATGLESALGPRMYNYARVEFPWTNRPQDYLLPFDRNFRGNINILLEGHAHTTLSDGSMTPEQLVEFYRASGFNALVVSDHNTVEGGLAAERYAQSRYPDDFLVIPAQEYSCCRIHMNFLNIRETIPVTSAFPDDTELRRVIRRVHELGGLVVVNHIPWSNKTESGYDVSTLPTHPSRQDLVALGIDGFEVMNGATMDTRSYLYLRDTPPNLRRQRPFQITGNDIHHPDDGVYNWTVMSAKNFTVDGIIEELRQRRTSFLVEPSGTRQRPTVPYNPVYLFLAPLTGIARYFTNFYDRRRGMYSFTGSFCQPERVSFHAEALLGLFLGIFFAIFFNRLAGLYVVPWIRRRYHRFRSGLTAF